MRDYTGYKAFAHNATSDRKERNANYRDNGQGEGYLLGKYFNAEVGAIDEEVKRLGLELNALAKHMGVTPDEGNLTQLNGVSPVGQIVMMSTSRVPSGYLKCDGAVLSRTTYADLYAEIGETYGGGTPLDTGGTGSYSGSIDYSWADGEWNLSGTSSSAIIPSGTSTNNTFSSFKLIVDSRRKVFYIKSIPLNSSDSWCQAECFFKIDTLTEENNGEIVLTTNTIAGTINTKITIKQVTGGLEVRYRYANSTITLATLSKNMSFTHKFSLPDFRGMFLRGHGGTNPNMSNDYGLKQLDAIENHTHQLDESSGGPGILRYSAASSGQTTGVRKDRSTFGMSSGRASSETRGVNYAVNYCIKY